ncbi:MAG: TIGR01777 family oxidoreductase [Methylomicrobium sp.]
MHILITGGTGFIGTALTRRLVGNGHRLTVLSRTPERVPSICGSGVTGFADFAEIQSDTHFDAVINLAGAPIFDKRWSAAQKRLLWDSRVLLTDRLIQLLERLVDRPQVLISGSAIGYYGDQGDTILDEESPTRDDFSHRLCAAWENSALQAERLDIRVCLIRTGLVLGHDGGLLQRMLLPFKLGLGGKLGDGRQWMSWIHRQDWINIVLAMMNDESMRGSYNATAPNPATNAEFVSALADLLKRPALLPAPSWALKLALGEMSELVLGSQRVIPARLLEQGFQFEYDELSAALSEALGIHSV